ncbi:hypothetical protein CPB83DRAFT_859742 [Crepidotus variabilis]|uniref:Uncharacterized protein n=1 Tax=Crepidotus variabilis TaxID=179855 RepID=A0A9P6EA64_9AGAR|nr:hypothetical protein CPB83DRAFT_859742 [Crepidotus variabilis]
MYNQPDKPLIVKCTFDKWHKRITFSSARNCSYDLLRRKVEQCFSLYGSAFAITYKDDDGEITNISTDDDLVEGIQYFQAGDDAPTSSAASILSGRSFGPRKITLRVDIAVDYDGPSLSDTSSLASLDDFKVRNGSQQSFSFGTPSLDLEDDSVTVSSRDPDTSVRDGSTFLTSERSISKQRSSQSWETSKTLGEGQPRLNGHHSDKGKGSVKSLKSSAKGSEYVAAADRYPSDPAAVFERLQISESLPDDASSVDFDHLTASERGAAWLRDQNERAIRSKLGALPEPSETDSFSLSESKDDLGGDLALERDPRGKYYYTYTSGSSASQAHGSIYEDVPNGFSERDSYVPGGPPRPTSMQLNWLASQRIKQPQDQFTDPNRPTSVAEEPPQIETHLIDPELLPFIPVPGPPPDILTDCSHCGVLLDAIRYVCASCGPKVPVNSNLNLQGQDREGDSPTTAYSYPPRPHSLFSDPQRSGSSQTLVGSPQPDFFQNKPLPSLPASMSSLPSSIHSMFAARKPHLNLPTTPPSPTRKSNGYELCALCLETVGINHAIEAGLAEPGSSPILSASPHNDPLRASLWRRAPPKKGQLRHAYQEKAWGHNGWEDVVLDEASVSQCSTCSALTERKRYKCISCEKMMLCRACYSQVHELHPSHAFCIVPDKPVQVETYEELNPALPEGQGEHSLMHPGVKCAHCLLDIVGARFHCAICPAIDICSNCESAGLPGNLDSADGGHISSHILIKIPYPLENTELKNASRRALHLWTGRDAANVAFGNSGPKAGSEISSYAQTMIGIAQDRSSEDHRLWCNCCGQPIIGVRYQCGHCPSKPTAYNLCSTCEVRSYEIHDPMHIFFKLPRAVYQPLEAAYPFLPPLYKVPAGPPGNLPQPCDPRNYLIALVHSAALCDRCMTPIQGEWFRCCYCARDLCDGCEDVDTHDDTHVFIVFKSIVDMQSFKGFANLDNHGGSSPIIPYPVYR